MKKIISALFVVVCLFMTTTAQAQIRFGVKGGLNLAQADLSGLKDNFKSDNMTGFFIGPMIDAKIPIVGLGLDASLLYSERGTKFTNTDNNSDVTNKQQALEIPVNLKYSIGLGDMASVFVAAGPVFSFKLDGDNITDDLSSIVTNGTTGTDISKKGAEVGLNLGAGVKLLNHFQVGVNYSLPLTDSASGDVGTALSGLSDGSSFKSKTKIWQVSVAYIF